MIPPGGYYNPCSHANPIFHEKMLTDIQTEAVMRIGDQLFLAPDLRFKELDLVGPDLPEQLERRIAGCYIEPA